MKHSERNTERNCLSWFDLKEKGVEQANKLRLCSDEQISLQQTEPRAEGIFFHFTLGISEEEDVNRGVAVTLNT